MGGQAPSGPAETVAVGFGRVPERNEGVRDIPVGSLEIQEGVQGVPDHRGIRHLQGELDEGVQIPDPDLLVAVPGVEAGGGDGKRHRIHPVHQRIREDLAEEHFLRVLAAGYGQDDRQECDGKQASHPYSSLNREAAPIIAARSSRVEVRTSTPSGIPASRVSQKRG